MNKFLFLFFNFVLAFFSLFFVSFFYKYPLFLFFILLFIVFLFFVLNFSFSELFLFFFSSFGGFFAEMFAVNFGVWSYSYTVFFNVPCWLFLLWGIASIFIVRIYNFIISF